MRAELGRTGVFQNILQDNLNKILRGVYLKNRVTRDENDMTKPQKIIVDENHFFSLTIVCASSIFLPMRMFPIILTTFLDNIHLRTPNCLE